MRHVVSGILGILVFIMLACAPALADRRVALVIANASYTHIGTLSNAGNDAQSIKSLLSAAGFATVDLRTNLGVSAFRRALADFELLSRDADVAVIYYSGHGMEFEGRNYLVPVDASIEREVDVKDEAVPLDRVLQAVSGATRLKLIILDACRSNPFQAANGNRAVNRGLGRVEPDQSNELIAYAAKAGTVAADGSPGGNSPYTSALLHHLTTPGLDIELALRRVRDEVLQSTRRQQEPYYYGSVGGTDMPLSTNGAALTQIPTISKIVEGLEGKDRAAVNSNIQTDSDMVVRDDFMIAKTIGTITAWDRFLNKYDSGYYADMAREARSQKADQKQSQETKLAMLPSKSEEKTEKMEINPPQNLINSNLWSHNGSTVRLLANGSSRKFVYVTVRPSLRSIGVKSGMLLFDGTRSSNNYSGTAFIFNRFGACHPEPYQVHGRVTADERQVILTGKAPVLNGKCKIEGFRNDVMVFSLAKG